MKRKVIFSALSIIIIAVAFGAGTMAWFTAKAEAPENTFTAGTVMIEAGGTVINSQYFDPESHWFLYGVELDTGNLYEIDINNQVATKFFDTPNLSPTDEWTPNGLAFDNNNRRLYFSITKGNNSEIWFYDLNEQMLIKSGIVNSAKIYGATFGQGYYWYINNGTDALYKVSFGPDGKDPNKIFVDNITGDENKKFNFGDVVMDIIDGVIYGSSSYSGQNTEFFKYDTTVSEDNYVMITDQDSKDLQIAFGSDGVLYGHRTGGPDAGKWFSIDTVSGSSTHLFTGNKSFTDLASGYISVWNPGDCTKVRYNVINTGSKDIRVRANLTADWELDFDWLWENWDALCFSEMDQFSNQDDWSREDFEVALDSPETVVSIELCDGQEQWTKENGFFYYTGEPIESGQEVELCLEVCLDGELANNIFQGGKYTLKVTFEAVQSSNYAPYYEWDGIDLYGVPD